MHPVELQAVRINERILADLDGYGAQKLNIDLSEYLHYLLARRLTGDYSWFLLDSKIKLDGDFVVVNVTAAPSSVFPVENVEVEIRKIRFELAYDTTPFPLTIERTLILAIQKKEREEAVRKRDRDALK